MAVAKIDAAHEHVARPHLLGERGVVVFHGLGGEFLDIGDLDVLHANDLVDVKIFVGKDPGDPAGDVFECHGGKGEGG